MPSFVAVIPDDGGRPAVPPVPARGTVVVGTDGPSDAWRTWSWQLRPGEPAACVLTVIPLRTLPASRWLCQVSVRGMAPGLRAWALSLPQIATLRQARENATLRAAWPARLRARISTIVADTNPITLLNSPPTPDKAPDRDPAWAHRFEAADDDPDNDPVPGL